MHWISFCVFGHPFLYMPNSTNKVKSDFLKVCNNFHFIKAYLIQYFFSDTLESRMKSGQREKSILNSKVKPIVDMYKVNSY